MRVLCLPSSFVDSDRIMARVPVPEHTSVTGRSKWCISMFWHVSTLEQMYPHLDGKQKKKKEVYLF